MNASLRKSRILIVDDESSNITILTRLFRAEYETVTVQNGYDALDCIEHEAFDLVLLDIMMPQISGLDVLKAIRENPLTAELPVILISARMDENDIVEGLTIGANDYITKPFRLAELRARVRTQVMLKHLQDERRQTIDELRTAHEMKDRFFRIASHDMKGPLSNLRLVHYLVRKRVDEDPQAMELLNTADANLDNMQNVINEFLDMAALQSGKIDLRMEEVPVEAVLNDVLRQYHLNALKKDIEVATHIGGVVYADMARFGQALGNLVSNALKYSPRQTTITIWTEMNGERVRLCVSDQGPGIPEDERDRLFTQFGKLSTRPTDGESSTGLGLWIAKHLTTLQGGEIGVESPDEGGSIFWIELPAVPVHAMAK
ncbi:MAG: response regulator [Chloroflexi bacterium]|nr:response regulator [Chloroflexota bacterium]